MFISLAAAAAPRERADRAGRVKAVVVVLRVDRLGDLALDFEADEKRLEERRARRVLPFGDGQRGGQRRHGRVRQQPERPIGRRRQLRVVVVHGVAARRVEQRGVRGRRHEAAGAERGGLLPGAHGLARSRARSALPLTVDPARMTPKPSTRQRFACATTSAGMLRSVVFVMNAVSASVVPLIAAFVDLRRFALPAASAGADSERRGGREVEEVLARSIFM